MSQLRVDTSDWADDWRADAACTGVDTDLFFPGGTTGEALLRTEAAKEICRSCPCRGDCLSFALHTNQEFGVWGGASEEERRQLRRTWRTGRRAAS